jgi:hypothetical protein
MGDCQHSISQYRHRYKIAIVGDRVIPELHIINILLFPYIFLISFKTLHPSYNLSHKSFSLLNSGM